MKSSGYTKKQLLQEIQVVREDLQEFKTKKVLALRESLDALEKRVNKVPANQKFAIQMDAAQLKTIKAGIAVLYSQSIAWFFRITNCVALFFGILMVVLYVIAGLTHRLMPQNAIGLTAWFTIGLVAGTLATLHFMLLLRAHIYLIIQQIRKYPNMQGFWLRAFWLMWFNHFGLSYLNMYGIILNITLAWVYPISFPFLREFYGGVMDGASHGNILSAMIILITIIGAVMSFVQGVVSMIRFVRKLRKKLNGEMLNTSSDN